MKKRIDIKQLVSTLISILLAMGIMLFLFLASGSAELEQMQQVEETPIIFTPSSDLEDAFVKVAENESYQLSANPAKGWISLTEKESGNTWYSLPEELMQEERIAGSQNIQLASLAVIRFANRDDNTTLQDSMTQCINKGNFAVQMTDNGIRFDLYFESAGFLIPVEISLTDRGMKASVIVSEIQEASSAMKLTGITLLPGFAAAKEGNEGFLFLPDGSGMTVPFASGNVNWTARVYGSDSAVVQTTKTKEEPKVLLPVFGVNESDKAIFSIITEGDARSRIRSVLPTSKSPYASVASELVFRESILVDVSQKTFEYTQVNMFEPAHTALPSYTVEYIPCENASLVGMAEVYRTYLQEDLNLTPQSDPTPALQTEFFGSISVKESVLGIPLERTKAITSFLAAKEQIDSFKKAGFSDLTCLYTNWAKGGSNSRLTVDVKAANVLGGKRGLQELLSHAADQKVNLYLDLNLTHMGSSQPGYSSRYDAAQSVKKEPAIQYEYLMSTFQINKNAELTFLLSPGKILDAAKQSAGNLSSFAPAGWAPSSLGNTIYSDFGSDSLDRGAAEEIYIQSLSILQEKSGSLLLKAPGGYALPYASVIQDAPITTSGSLAQGNAVPFYTMALRGFLPMSTPAINNKQSENQTLLAAFECGVGLKVLLGEENVHLLPQAGLSALSGMEAERWMDEAARQAGQLVPYLQAVGNSYVTEYEVLAEGVRKTVFANGVGVIVNYTQEDVTTADGVVPAGSYLPIGWEA